MERNYDNDRQYRNHGTAQRRNRPQTAAQKKSRKKRLLIRRIKIVTGGLLILGSIIVLLILLIRALVAGFSAEAEPTVAPTAVPTEAPVVHTFNKPDIPDDKKTDGYYSTGSDNVYVYNKAAYECFNGNAESAQYYADCISDFKAQAGDDIKVYNMVVPTHTEFGIPKRLVDEGKVNTVSQADNISSIYTGYNSGVIPISCYNKLSEHFKEYIYFNTDDHWTGLGGYYAYSAFCEQTKNKTLDLAVCKEHTISDFEGYYTYIEDSMYENLDTVHYWTFPYDTYAMRTDDSDSEPYEISVYFEGEESGPYSYGVFLWGDCSLFVEHNKDLTNGKKIAVVKDSYGNAFAPYLTADYEEVHVIDYRYFEGSVTQYLKDNSISEILFLNNVMSANSIDDIRTLRSIF